MWERLITDEKFLYNIKIEINYMSVKIKNTLHAKLKGKKYNLK